MSATVLLSACTTNGDEPVAGTASTSSSSVPPAATASTPSTAPIAPPAADGQSVAVPEPGPFLETFDGQPESPEAWRRAGWDVTIHSRDIDTFGALQPMQADHGPDCAGPPASHPTGGAYESAVYTCRDHVMTAINSSGYGMIYLTPDRMVDFSDGAAVIRFDVSTARTSIRDWWDVWITPYDDNLQLPLDLGSDVDVSGAPRNAVHVTLGTEHQLRASVYDEFAMVTFPDWPEHNVTGDVFTGYQSFLEPDASRRDTVEIAISKNHLRVGMPEYDFWWVDAEIPDLGWSQAVVQLGHHSYNPTKDCDANAHILGVDTDVCRSSTWHWDNVSIDPATPFTIDRATSRYADENSPAVVLESPAPPDAHVRFTGIGRPIQVRFDDGPWEDAQIQRAQRQTKDEHFASFWQPVPEGTTTVTFRGIQWWGGPWHVRDVSVWSRARESGDPPAEPATDDGGTP